jgi:hypothetical protein
MVRLYNFTNGTLADATQVNTNTEYILSNFLWDAAINSKNPRYGAYNATVIGSDMVLAGGSYFLSGILYDDYADSSLNTSLNTIGSILFRQDGGTGFGFGSFEWGGSFTFIGSTVVGGGTASSITVSDTFSRNFHTVGSKDIANITIGFGGNYNQSNTSRLKYGNITLDSSASAGTIYQYYVVLNETKTSASVYRNGTSLGTVSLAGKTGSNFYVDYIGSSNGAGTWIGSLVVYDSRFIGSGMTGTGSNYITYNDSLSGSGMGGLYLGSLVAEITNINPIGSFSMNNGTNYTIGSMETLTKGITVGSTVISKISFVYPGSNVYVALKQYGYVYG